MIPLSVPAASNVPTVVGLSERYKQTLADLWIAHKNPKPSNRTFISTFAGCGGSSLGYSASGFHELLAVEWDAHATECFRLNFPDVPIYQGDINKLEVGEVLERTSLRPGELTLLDGSPPCQGFSTSNANRDVSDPRNELFSQYVRLLHGLKPQMFVMENVTGMVKGELKAMFRRIYSELKESGYKVLCRKLEAKYLGIPQMRERLIFVGVRDDVAIEPKLPEPKLFTLNVCDVLPNISEIITAGSMFNYKSSKRPFPTITKSIYHQVEHRHFCGGHFVVTTDGVKRRPTIPELALLQSFPSEYQFCGTEKQQSERIGNSVPPLMAYEIGKVLNDSLDKLA